MSGNCEYHDKIINLKRGRKRLVPLKHKSELIETLSKESLFDHKKQQNSHKKWMWETQELNESRDNTDPDIACHGTPYNYEAFDPAKIWTGEGIWMHGNGLYLKRSKRVTPFYANINSPDAPIRIWAPKSRIDQSSLNPRILEVHGIASLKLFKGPEKFLKRQAKLNQQEYINQWYDWFETPNGEIIVFPESMHKLTIQKRYTIDEFVLSNPNMKFREWTTDQSRIDKLESEKKAT